MGRRGMGELRAALSRLPIATHSIDRVGSRSDHGAQRTAADRRVGWDRSAGPADSVLRCRRSGRDPTLARRARWTSAADRSRVHLFRDRLSRAGPLRLATRRVGPAGVLDLGPRGFLEPGEYAPRLFG